MGQCTCSETKKNEKLLQQDSKRNVLNKGNQDVMNTNPSVVGVENKSKTDETIKQHQSIINEAIVGVDLTEIFKVREVTNCDKSTTKCLCLKRMCIGLKYYEMLFGDETTINMSQQKK
eukprot:487494_1